MGGYKIRRISRLVILLVGILLIFITGCNYNGLQKSKYNEINDQTSIKIALNKPSYPLTKKNIMVTYKITNNSTHTITFEQPVELDINHDGSWYKIPLARNVHWINKQNRLSPGQTYTQKLNLFFFGYIFSEGQYRIVKTYSIANDSKKIPITKSFKLIKRKG